MYNKLFTKILDSSIWLAPDPHRIVWITFLAVMDEDGNAMFASAGNLAARARVSRTNAESAIAAFEAPDPDSGDPEFDGRRIERFPGGWHILNAAKYRALVTRATIQAQTRERTARWRAKQLSDAQVTQPSRTGDETVTPSEAVSEAVSREKTKTNTKPPRKRGLVVVEGFNLFWQAYPRKVAKPSAEKAFAKLAPSADLLSAMAAAIARQRSGPQWTKDGGQFIPHPATWLNKRHWEDEEQSASTPPGFDGVR